MKSAAFRYHRPTSVREALDILADVGRDASVLAGGQSLVPILARRAAQVGNLIDLNAIRELAGIHLTEREVVVRAMTRQSDLVDSDLIASQMPVLARAASMIGHATIRNRGTLGGSIAHADPAAELPATAVALEATIEVTDRRGVHDVAARDFFKSRWTTSLANDELLSAVRFPIWGGKCGWSVREFSRRHNDLALVGVVCGVSVVDDSIDRITFALFGMGATPVRAAAAEAAVVGARVGDIDLIEVGTLATADIDPPDDIHAPGAYRLRIAQHLTAQALQSALTEACA